MQEMSSIRAMPEKSDAEKLAELHIGLSVIALGLTTAGHLFFPPLRLLGMACLLYGWRYLLRKAYKSLFVERRMSVEVIDCFFQCFWRTATHSLDIEG